MDTITQTTDASLTYLRRIAETFTSARWYLSSTIEKLVREDDRAGIALLATGIRARLAARPEPLPAVFDADYRIEHYVGKALHAARLGADAPGPAPYIAPTVGIDNRHSAWTTAPLRRAGTWPGRLAIVEAIVDVGSLPPVVA